MDFQSRATASRNLNTPFRKGKATEKRAFHPHLTLGRVKGREPDAVAALGEYVSRARVRVGEMRAEAVHLMRSELLPGGAIYTELATAQLSG